MRKRERRWRESILFWCAVVTTGATLAALGWAVATFLLSSSPSAANRHEGRVEITQAYVKNGAEESYVGPKGGERQALSAAPTVELMLYNGTGRRVLVVGARVQIEAYGELSLCFSQGGGPVPEPSPYTIHLHARPLPSERFVAANLHDQIPAGEPDRIGLRLASPDSGFEHYSLYRLKIQLVVHGSARPLDAGRFVVVMPSTLPSYGQYLPEDNATLQQFVTGPFKSSRLSTTWCFKRNLSQLQAVLSGPGERSSELGLLDHPVIANGWGRLQDHLSAHAAALALLHEEPQLAAYAAAQSGHAQFAREIAVRAAARQLQRADELVAQSGPSTFAEQEVRASLLLHGSPQALRTLAELKRRLAEIPSSVSQSSELVPTPRY
jgi:hypothetical protein